MGTLFFLSLDRLWPMADTDLTPPARRILAEARDWFEGHGHALVGYDGATALWVADAELGYVERAFGRESTQASIRDGAPLVGHRVDWKKSGDPRVYRAWVHAEKGLLAWSYTVEDDVPGASPTEQQALELASGGLAELVSDPDAYRQTSVTAQRLPGRTDHRFTFERLRSTEPELRETVDVTVFGDQVGRVARNWNVPPSALRARRGGEGPGVALETLGVVLLVLGALAAFVIFLGGLQAGKVRLREAAVWPMVVLVGLIVTHLLDAGSSFFRWDPLSPRWVSLFRTLVEDHIQTLWILLVLLAVYAAGTVLDQQGRGRSLVLCSQGHVTHPAVGWASLRGFLVGLICGGTLTLAVRALEFAADATVHLQPRGFFFYTLNSSAPLLTSIAFFLGVALTEELGYRYFGGNWLVSRTGSRLWAVLIPATIYGLTHTRLDFLPPETPWWGRAMALTMVGCVWGWAYFRYDALTVVLSHLTADLFIFNSPLLASSNAPTRWAALATVALPLLPAVLAGGQSIRMQLRSNAQRPPA